ncbi:polyprenyl synthetase family protein [Pseudobdellovibrio exovorus]|uniref:Geranyltranstransferase n=1 Tax=Pseudobdellovibrio exovorus JSS TaxID=1184267 RepID=M4VTK6_9BACT|nr:polyprenyl synthetase family protein [Pseudobdellovibrio exovorus]AGH96519.1 geranyltranstransferase [Pseudobdellovibrio exovorus JSS]
MNYSLEQEQQQFCERFEGWLSHYLETQKQSPLVASKLLESQSYSLLSGGKRFRPFLSFLCFRLFSESVQKIRSLCLALEMVHTYSLIHDDLPCMDNDDFRRGKPTNHKVFSEDIALLAGDGLLTDVFYLLSSDELLSPPTRVAMIRSLSERIGSAGMVSGQVLDMQATEKVTYADLQKIHRLKTAHLIQASAVGGALAADAKQEDVVAIYEFAFHLGMAFQIKDDLLDATDKEQDFKSYLSVLGKEKTVTALLDHSQQAQQWIQKVSVGDKTALQALIEFNFNRKN